MVYALTAYQTPLRTRTHGAAPTVGAPRGRSRCRRESSSRLSLDIRPAVGASRAAPRESRHRRPVPETVARWSTSPAHPMPDVHRIVPTRRRTGWCPPPMSRASYWPSARSPTASRAPSPTDRTSAPGCVMAYGSIRRPRSSRSPLVRREALCRPGTQASRACAGEILGRNSWFIPQFLPRRIHVAVEHEQAVRVTFEIGEVVLPAFREFHVQRFCQVIDVEPLQSRKRPAECIVFIGRFVADALRRGNKPALARSHSMFVDDVNGRIQADFLELELKISGPRLHVDAFRDPAVARRGNIDPMRAWRYVRRRQGRDAEVLPIDEHLRARHVTVDVKRAAG